MDGDEVDFEQWYEAEHPRLVRSLVVAAPSLDLAHDCADEAFARAYARWDRVSRMESPVGWTYRVAVNVIRRRLRRHTLEVRMLARSRPEEAVDAPIPDVDLWDAVKGLPERQRLAVALRYVGGLTEAQVAEAMGVRPGTAAATLSKARTKLAQALRQQAEGEIEVTAWQT